jgi:hypothetical protein
MKAILAEAEEMQVGNRTRYPPENRLIPVPQQLERSRSGDGDGLRVASSLPKKVQRAQPLLQSTSPGTTRAVSGTGQTLSRTPPKNAQASADGMRVAFSLPKMQASGLPPHSGSPGISRVASGSTTAWKVPSPLAEPSRLPMGSPPSIPPIMQTLSRNSPPPGVTQVSEKASPTALHVSVPAPALQKSRSAQSMSSPSMLKPGLGPVISPSKAKAGLTATRPASYVARPSTERYRHKYSLARLVLYSRARHIRTAGMRGYCLP